MIPAWGLVRQRDLKGCQAQLTLRTNFFSLRTAEASRKKKENRRKWKRYLLIGLATVGGGTVIGKASSSRGGGTWSVQCRVTGDVRLGVERRWAGRCPRAHSRCSISSVFISVPLWKAVGS